MTEVVALVMIATMTIANASTETHEVAIRMTMTSLTHLDATATMVITDPREISRTLTTAESVTEAGHRNDLPTQLPTCRSLLP